MSKKYIHHQDPGHGWVGVKRAELERLGILTQVSPYSYARGDTVYLEEDCDALLWVNAKRAAGERFEWDSRHTDRSSPIRNYPRLVDVLKSEDRERAGLRADIYNATRANGVLITGDLCLSLAFRTLGELRQIAAELHISTKVKP